MNKGIIMKIQQGITVCTQYSCETRACTGFDGDSEVEEAIRGAGPRSKP